MATAKGSIAVTATTATIVAANEYRKGVVVQFISGDPFSVAFEVDAVFGEGVQLSAANPVVRVSGHLARKAVAGVCDTTNSAVGSYQEF